MTLPPTRVEEILHPGVDPRIRLFRAGEEIDTLVVSTRRFMVFVDTMSTPTLMRQITEVMRPSLNGRAVLVLNTHADWDHVYGNSLFVPGGQLPAPILGSRWTRERLLSVPALERLRSQQQEQPRFGEVTLVPPDLTFEDGFTLHGGDLTLELLHTPGHTPDHFSVWIPELRTVLAGDAAEYPFPSVRDGRALPQVRASLERLAGLRAEVVLPCHGGTTSPDLPAQNLAYFRTLSERLATLPDPAEWLNRPDEAAVQLNLSYEETLERLGSDADHVPAFYRGFHTDALRATLEELNSRRLSPEPGGE